MVREISRLRNSFDITLLYFFYYKEDFFFLGNYKEIKSPKKKNYTETNRGTSCIALFLYVISTVLYFGKEYLDLGLIN